MFTDLFVCFPINLCVSRLCLVVFEANFCMCVLIPGCVHFDPDSFSVGNLGIF